jgi:arginine repressor
MIVLLASLIVGAAAPQPIADTPSGAEIAECVVDNDKANVRALLKTVPGSPAEAKVIEKLLVFYGGCSDNKRATGTFSWRERAEIAEATLAGTLDRKGPDIVAAVGQEGWGLALPSSSKASVDYDPVNVGVRTLGDCIVRANPQGALALVRTDRGSAGETAAVNDLSGNLAACLPAGQTLKLKRQDLRLVVAEPLYHVMSR